MQSDIRIYDAKTARPVPDRDWRPGNDLNWQKMSDPSYLNVNSMYLIWKSPRNGVFRSQYSQRNGLQSVREPKYMGVNCRLLTERSRYVSDISCLDWKPVIASCSRMKFKKGMTNLEVERSRVTLCCKQRHASLARAEKIIVMWAWVSKTYVAGCHVQEESPFILRRMPLVMHLSRSKRLR